MINLLYDQIGPVSTNKAIVRMRRAVPSSHSFKYLYLLSYGGWNTKCIFVNTAHSSAQHDLSSLLYKYIRVPTKKCFKSCVRKMNCTLLQSANNNTVYSRFVAFRARVTRTLYLLHLNLNLYCVMHDVCLMYVIISLVRLVFKWATLYRKSKKTKQILCLKLFEANFLPIEVYWFSLNEAENTSNKSHSVIQAKPRPLIDKKSYHCIDIYIYAHNTSSILTRYSTVSNSQ